MAKDRVLVAMSGGVDSSVAAALLLQQGYEVIGVTLLMQPPRKTDGIDWCCSSDAETAARDAAAQLGIYHETIVCHEPFVEKVLRPCWEEYAGGRTPNPCALCNRRIKWAFLLEHARAQGADFVATGHYARVMEVNGHPTLWRGLDRAKDQAYFLFDLDSDQLAATLFPLGGMEKSEVRDCAMTLGLDNAQRPDSQDICFAGDEGNFADTLGRFLGEEPLRGTFVDESGKVIGQHAGVHLFTVGQRRGLGIALGERAYVTAIDAERGTVTVSCDETLLESGGLVATDVRWQASVDNRTRHVCEVQTRYRQHPVPATVFPLGDGLAHVVFDEPVKAVTPGQVVVFFGGDRVLGGGWIREAIVDGEQEDA